VVESLSNKDGLVHMAEQGFTQEQVDALASKLSSIDFTAEERSVLHTIFEIAASGGEVQGFDLFNLIGYDKLLDSVKAGPSKPFNVPSGSTWRRNFSRRPSRAAAVRAVRSVSPAHCLWAAREARSFRSAGMRSVGNVSSGEVAAA
jgi:hypothetical protein